MRHTLPSGTDVEIARPSGSPRIGLVVTPDIFGLRPLYDNLVSQWATEWGMAVAAVDPFPGKGLGADIEPRYAAVKDIDDDKHLSDLHEAADMLNTPVTVLMGFCMGGMYCFKSARSSRFARIASFYGMITLPEAWRSAGQVEPLQYLETGNAASVLAIIGGKDHYTPAHDVDALRATGATIAFYPEGEHAFAHDATRPAHRAEDAADAFRRAKEWLSEAK